jgi:hypothetical protein
MANTIQIKRSSANAAPTGLAKGELAWVDHGTGGGEGCLYIGDMTGAGAAVRMIGGTGTSSFADDILNNSPLTGVPTAPTAAASVDTTQVATTAFVHDVVAANGNPISQASDTDISGSQTAGAMLIWDGVDTWNDKSLSGDVTINSAGATTVNSVAANSVNLGTDTVGNYISTITGTANEVEVSVNGVESAAVTIGLPNNVTIAGNLTVQGTTTQVDSTVVTVADPIFTLGADAADSKDRGIVMKYNDGSSRLAWMGMDDGDNKFKYIAQATNTSEVMSGALGDAAFGNIDGTLTTASQTAITGVGTLTAGTWNADVITSTYGGLGIDTSSSTGVGTVSGGTWSVQSEMPVALGGTGLQTITSGCIVLGAGTADMTVLTKGTAGQLLKMNSGATAPEWTDIMDGGTF